MHPYKTHTRTHTEFTTTFTYSYKRSNKRLQPHIFCAHIAIHLPPIFSFSIIITFILLFFFIFSLFQFFPFSIQFIILLLIHSFRFHTRAYAFYGLIVTNSLITITKQIFLLLLFDMNATLNK